ncbi:MAG: hypothetical protein AVDCRST_MAG93-3867 [uncultured Chloroflexia bacterium]|uniref:Uncharacterized protein n=1 Tax=uncultured Chloroflexia bacterium TaxID=1672391 RepID=A0A6J4JYL5_9CHLR|nr:MAG: hypothetical protein AVDCRST_MAG93-3867 [uncultured Chloroflexia bacterium]
MATCGYLNAELRLGSGALNAISNKNRLGLARMERTPRV